MTPPSRDWSDYTALELDVYNESDYYTYLDVGVADSANGWYPQAGPEILLLPNAATHIIVPIAEMARDIDVSHVDWLAFEPQTLYEEEDYLGRLRTYRLGPRTLYFDNIRLVRVVTPQPPSISTFEPDGGSGRVGGWADFTTTYSDPNGYEDIAWAFFFLDREPPIASGGLAAAYYQPADVLLLLGGGLCRPGQAKSLTTAYITLDCHNSSVSGEGDTLTINWRVRPEQCFAGGRDVDTEPGKWLSSGEDRSWKLKKQGLRCPGQSANPAHPCSGG